MTRDQIDTAIDALNDLIALRVGGFSLAELHVESGAAKRFDSKSSAAKARM